MLQTYCSPEPLEQVKILVEPNIILKNHKLNKTLYLAPRTKNEEGSMVVKLKIIENSNYLRDEYSRQYMRVGELQTSNITSKLKRKNQDICA